MKTALLFCWLLIGILSAHGLDKKQDNKSKVTPDEDTKIKVSETKDKRQIGSSDTASYSNDKQDDPEQPQETIYGPKPNHLLIRPLSPHDQQLRNYQPTSRPHSQQLQALGPQLEQSQEIQHFAYLQDTSRNHQAKAVAEGKSHTLVKKPSSAQLQQYAAEEQYAQQQLQSQAQVRFTPAHGQFRPSEYIPQQQQQEQQQQQAQYQTLQEEQLLKLIEEELQARALQEAQARASYSQAGPQGRPVERQGLVNYRSKPEEAPEYSGYSQAPRAGPHQGPQYLPQQQQQHLRAQPQQQTQSQQVNFYHGPSAVSYRTLPNHPLAESSLEREIEKLLASNRPSGYRHSSPPALLSSRSPFLQPKSYSTTATPPTTVGQASQYYSPSVVQYNGFQPSPTAPTNNLDHQQHKKYIPSAYSTSQPQYVIESSPSPSKPSKSSSSSGGQYRVKLHTSKSKPQGKPNLGPVQFYYGEPNQQQPQHAQPSPSQQQQEYQQYAVPSAAPSQSSIYVSQSTGVQPSQKTKIQGNSKHLELPPPDGKPITQAEFQALVDAGYPVQAVPVPVPVPYDQYIKDHPEYTGEQLEVPHRHTQRGAPSEGGAVTYLRPLPSERQQQQPRHPREQKEEISPGKKESS